jgi:tetratricopeptide (TPR) repeat protein
MKLVRSLNVTGLRRTEYERDAIDEFQLAAGDAPDTWQFTYNWALANYLVGNYFAAYEGMKSVIDKAEVQYNLLPQFWVGVAALRAGDPGEAIVRLTPVLDKKAPVGSNEALVSLYTRLNTLGREALGDAQWANRDPAAAYKTYLDALRTSNGNTGSGPYGKWLRVGLQQRGYESLLDDMSTLLNTSDALGKDARIHHDRARLLTFLGRGGEAMQEYRRAVELGENDPPLFISYGQALASQGDYTGALGRAQDAIRGLGFDPATIDLKGVARTAADSTSILKDVETSQYLLDANLLRARVFGRQGNTSGLASLVQGITQEAPSLSPNEGGLLFLYGAFANEAGGQNAQARENFSSAWEKLKGLPPGTPGRAAALTGLARTTASTQSVDAALDLLKSNNYDPVSPPTTVATDADAPDILDIGSKLLSRAGRSKEAANTIRVSAVTRNLRDARLLSGVGRQLWAYNGTLVPADAILSAADAERAAGGDTSLAVMRYKQAYGLAPALAPAWNNLGVLYAQQGNTGRADFYLRSSGIVSPGYAWGQHNYAAYAYRQGLGNFLAAESAAGSAIKSAGARSLLWGYNLRYDERGIFPAPSGPENDLLSRLPALIIVLLLLLHTIVGSDRVANRSVVPTRGVLGRLATALDARFKIPARAGSRALVGSLAIPALVGMLGLAWGAARGSLEVALVFLPVALIAALLAFGANEVAQYLAARRAGVSTLHHNWPIGVLLGIVSIPFGFVYGWQINTRIASRVDEEGAEDASGAHTPQSRRTIRSLEERELLYEAQAEAAADEAAPIAGALPLTGAGSGRLGLTTGGRIMFAGLAANLVLGLIFGLVYWLTGWPSMRLALFAQALVLAFTAVSEPPADGWTLYRRNSHLWLATFVFASTVVTLLAIGII